MAACTQGELNFCKELYSKDSKSSAGGYKQWAQDPAPFVLDLQ